jgi:adenosylmethionine-8-amino-7-oxononanoate aminotransferase
VADHVYQTIADASAEIGVFGHGYTYSGHPLACAVALETLRIYESDRVVEHVAQVGPRLQAGLAITEAQIDELLEKFDRALADTQAWVTGR